MRRITAALGGGFLLMALSAGAAQPIKVSVSPAMGYGPTNLSVYVSMERHADNRLLRVVAESDEFSEGSERQLEGEDGPRVATFVFRHVPAGNYEIRAMVMGADGRVRARAAAKAAVMSVDR